MTGQDDPDRPTVSPRPRPRPGPSPTPTLARVVVWVVVGVLALFLIITGLIGVMQKGG